MDPRSSRLPSAPPDAGFLDLWQCLIGALGTLAADCDRLWRQRRRVLDTLPVMLFVSRLVFAPPPPRLQHRAGRAVAPVPGAP